LTRSAGQEDLSRRLPQQALLWLCSAGRFWPERMRERSAAELMDVVMWDREPIGGPFRLVDHDGVQRTDADFRGKLLLIYFGFTYCSTSCPIDLQTIATVMDRLGKDAERVQPLFVTINPEMDTPAQLKPCVSLFHPRLIGLTGDGRQVRRVTGLYKVFASSSQPLQRTGTDFDHSSFVYLVGTDGKYLGFFPPGTAPERTMTVLKPQLARLALR
jgi:cytochrome oxidase Cu insertion factor (SCO1/SenC/PrrC family)